ncbi:MAG: hypothetical protein SFU25_05435 [Candidatus Caenarcaniphilales bacterium]|nr:hypothetical protein [Candidatus Caenarcaniphilales bacterium]
MFSNITELLNLWSEKNLNNPEQDARRILEKIWKRLEVSSKTRFKSFDKKKGLLIIEAENLFLIANLQLQSKKLLELVNCELTKEPIKSGEAKNSLQVNNLRFRLIS